MKTNGNFYIRVMLLALLSLCVAVSCTKKYALVIGNKEYIKPATENLTRLINPVNDAESMKCALEILGWKVDILLDGKLQDNEGCSVKIHKKIA